MEEHTRRREQKYTRTLRLSAKQQFENEQLQIYDIINNSQYGAVRWLHFMDKIKKLLKKSYADELITGKKIRIKHYGEQ
jgi:hypothetical protein